MPQPLKPDTLTPNKRFSRAGGGNLFYLLEKGTGLKNTRKGVLTSLKRRLMLIAVESRLHEGSTDPGFNDASGSYVGEAVIAPERLLHRNNMATVLVLRESILLSSDGRATEAARAYVYDQIETSYLEDRERAFVRSMRFPINEAGQVIVNQATGETMTEMTAKQLDWLNRQVEGDERKEFYRPWAEAEDRIARQVSQMALGATAYDAIFHDSPRVEGIDNELAVSMHFADESWGRSAQKVFAIVQEGGQRFVELVSTFFDQTDLEEQHYMINHMSSKYGSEETYEGLSSEEMVGTVIPMWLGGIATAEQATAEAISETDNFRYRNTGIRSKHGWSVASGKSELANEIMSQSWECQQVIKESYDFFELLAYNLDSRPDDDIRGIARSYLSASRPDGSSYVKGSHIKHMQKIARGEVIIGEEEVEMLVAYMKYAGNIIMEMHVEGDQDIIDVARLANSMSILNASGASLAANFVDNYVFSGTCESGADLLNGEKVDISDMDAAQLQYHFEQVMKLDKRNYLENLGGDYQTVKAVCANWGNYSGCRSEVSHEDAKVEARTRVLDEFGFNENGKSYEFFGEDSTFMLSVIDDEENTFTEDSFSMLGASDEMVRRYQDLIKEIEGGGLEVDTLCSICDDCATVVKMKIHL